MILCLIILIVGIVSLVVGIFAAHKDKHSRYTDTWGNITIVCLVLGVMCTVVTSTLLIVMPMSCNHDLSIFINQKEYIESYEPTSEYDTAAITNKKVELNEWLYAVQHTKEHFPICSFYGDEILQIEPIK
jgi:hypothetical protein